MQTVICLGDKACDIGEKFENNDNYKVKLLDIDIEGDNCFSLKRYESPEEYEKNTPNFKKFFHDISDDVLFITSGDSELASCSLKLLEQIKNKNISVSYIIPEIEFLSETQILQSRAIFKIFQEYARSALFAELILLDEKNTETIIGDLPITEVADSYNSLIYNCINSIYNLQNADPIIKYDSKPNPTNRICSIGYYDLESDTEKLFFNLNLIQNKCYNFFINEENLKNDNTLYKKIKQKIKSKTGDNIKLSYTIHSTKNNNNYCYLKAYTKIIQ